MKIDRAMLPLAAIALAFHMTIVVAQAQSAAQMDAERRADEILQQRLDQMNAQRVLSGPPVITLEEYKQDSKENRERLQKALSNEIERVKNDPVIQKELRKSGNCGAGMVPVRGGCDVAYQQPTFDARTGKWMCYPPRFLSNDPLHPERNQPV
jgi:hypothetical protein